MALTGSWFVLAPRNFVRHLFFFRQHCKRRFDSIARNVADEVGAEDLISNCGKYFELAILE